MASVATQQVMGGPKPKFKPIINAVGVKEHNVSAEFDPKEHLSFKPPSEIIMMKDLGFPEGAGVSPVAVSQPFPLFSRTAVQEMRSEIMKPQVWEECSYSSNLAACQLRGYAQKHAKFTYDAFHNPETLAIISKIAGVDLVPVLNFEIGHINISVKSEEQTKQELDTLSKQKRLYADDEGIAGCPWEDDKPIVGWHVDSYPFVCVLMLSDCTNMVGGETALRTGDGNILKVRGPDMGCAVILQGRYITHQALRAIGAQERITSVTSFRPRSAHLADDSVLDTVRPISDLSELYYEFNEYRLEIIEERIRDQLKRLRENRRVGKKFETKAFKAFLAEQERFLAHSNHETMEDEKVRFGYIEEIEYPNAPVAEDGDAARTSKRARPS